jgi:hypothetical protein
MYMLAAQGKEPPIEGTFPFPCWEVKILCLQVLGVSEAFGFAIGYVLYVCMYVYKEATIF